MKLLTPIKKIAQAVGFLLMLVFFLVLYIFFNAEVYYPDEVKPPVSSVNELPAKLSPETLLEEVNAQRVEAGVTSLRLNTSLNSSAGEKCRDMVLNNYYDHVNPLTGKAGYEYARKHIPSGVVFSENLNFGAFFSAADVVSSKDYGWMASSSHRGAILDPKYTDTGFAICAAATSQAGTSIDKYVVQHLGQLE